MHLEDFKFFTQQYFIADLSISFNSNFLEANVLNILLLLSGLIYVLKNFLGAILSERQEKVLLAIQESEERLQQANRRLQESEKQLDQTKIVISQIIQESETTSARVRQSILDQGKIDVEKLTASSKASIISAENQVKYQIQQQITALAITKVTAQLKDQMTGGIQSDLIDKSIIQLKGNINI
uniref:ATP synthase CF0 subunit I n=1 Tax=Anotrichium furcellatum TaxID=41999 RepID=A0A4D6WNA2_9FLOR|nr:ATP synthase CF0 subunit I [Anotrichium furcellatum]